MKGKEKEPNTLELSKSQKSFSIVETLSSHSVGEWSNIEIKQNKIKWETKELSTLTEELSGYLWSNIFITTYWLPAFDLVVDK